MSEKETTISSLLKSIEDKCSVWNNKLTEQWSESNAAEKEVCNFLTRVLTEIDSKVVHHEKADNGEDKKLTEVEGDKEAGTEPKNEVKKKVKGEDDNKRQRLTFEEMLDQLIVYCRENKMKTIPKAEGTLSRWVHNQRKAWKKLLTKQKTTMTTERVRVLSDAGF
jgi:hypothetical protein